jgi:hypothetical protein
MHSGNPATRKIVFGLSTIIKQFQLDIAGTPICGAYATTPYIPPCRIK